MRVLFLSIFFAAAFACAAESPVRLALVSAARSPAAGEVVPCALRFEMDEGWHIYSDAPQETGYPPSAQWQLPEGWRAGALQFPKGRAFADGGGVGYDGVVYLPVTLTAAPALAAPAQRISVVVEALACGETCVPLTLTASLTFPQTPSAATVAALGDAGTRAPATTETPLAVLFAFAVLGGLILNVMPCVFPVIGLKIMGFVSQSGGAPRGILKHGLLFAAGVFVSLWTLAGVLFALRAAGAQLGWGFQLQSPIFTFFLCALFFVFGLNLLGVFEVGGRLTGAGAGLARTGGALSAFLSGVLAVVVATPCSAPFFAPVVGAALALPAAASLALFTGVGVGLSAPYVALCAFPKWLSKLPKPGAWMETTRQIFGWLFLGTAAYLLWVLAGLTAGGEWPLLRVLGALWLLGTAAWIYGRWATLSAAPRARRAASVAAACVFAAAAWLGVSATTAQPDALDWQPYSAERLDALRAEGRIVWVDFTARWCVTCLTNKATLAASTRLRALLKEKNVALLKADWTRRDETITRALAAFGRASVPFNLLYFPDAKEPLELPTVLTPDDVIAPLEAVK